ncbi:sulfate adenylyltransferase [Hyperthermus butylicus]|uniref:Sulfate adenylyltransferase n=1 Tax=Hyperthermus butylicus (strain DSM 5456 / JCM 9403 / PLM1-5) TaxID=415426 RepID=SAT_HYPBU|nr:sulfate adenylyltransferase [Hyperthermus butylicus]A2BMW0.1 RecName: Full=Sulfate adenylyltransferase; AltName: Full=ATP-sulfurylase; AltName: Full=Sulfate adenylate transferase; Short=SAT [Hyperthermus butylicus DSM 5456]ABM81321.1 Sulfate adenylyltransferase [Hyperthermus butylicus DSM 5456]
MVSRPHGGRLVDRTVSDKRRERLREEARELPAIRLTAGLAADVANIAHGVYSPLEGFMLQEDYLSVLDEMRLSNDLPWTIPIILDVDPGEIAGVREGDDIALVYNGKPIALMRVEEIYGWDRKEYAAKVFKTTDPAHPGVAKTMKRKELLIGGPIDLIEDPPEPFERYRLWPKETRVLFKARGWKTIAAFQTRNVPHLGHEYVQKAALTFTDGLFVNPLVGWKKPGDYRDEVIVEAYQALIKHYFPVESVVFSVLRMEMRYAGPREAIHHAIVRKNFGATHFIVGRDHAGVGNYYGPYEAWELFREFPDLGITPLFVREAFYCRKCGQMVNEKICPHPEEYRVRISGTKLRRMLLEGQRPPEYMMRPEVVDVVLKHPNPFIEGDEAFQE